MRKEISLLLCGAMALSLAACAPEVEAEVMDPTVTVRTAAVELGSLSNDSTYMGTVSAEGTASIIPLVAGMVENVYVSVGDTVVAGQSLCRFDDESARLTLQSAQAGMATAEAAVRSANESYQSALANYAVDEEGRLTLLEEQVAMAEDNYEDTKALFEAGIASQAELDQAYQTMLSAQAGIEAAQASLKAAEAGIAQAQSGVASAQVGVASAEYQLSLYDLTTPISGVVESVNVTENNFFSGGMAFVISNGNNKTVTFNVTDHVRQTLKSGQEVQVTAGGRSYEGYVTEISGMVNAATGLFQVKAVVDNGRDLPDGLVVELTTKAYEVENAIIIPSDALYFEDGNAYVYVAKDGVAVRTDVELGLYTADSIAILSGLELGDEVITTWSATLKDGVDIRVTEDAGAAE